jgi:hypothetical protein
MLKTPEQYSFDRFKPWTCVATADPVHLLTQKLTETDVQ